jgi:5-formyltetrahydrofolate cyclo-ligase
LRWDVTIEGMPEDAPERNALAMLKSVLRRQLRARLKGLHVDERRAQSVAAARQLQPLIHAQRERRGPSAPVALFVSMAWEIDTEPLDVWLRSASIPRALPAIVGDEMIFRRVDGDTPAASLPRGVWGIPAPDAQQPEVGLEDCAVVVCPGLAFDRFGRRLGQGRGYYDRALSAARARGDLLAIGFGLDQQEVEAVPTDERDQPLDGLLVPGRGLRRFGR